MRKVLFARHNYAKALAYRLMTTIEQDEAGTRVYKRALNPLADPYLESLLAKQQLIADFISDRATVILGRRESDGRVSYPFVAHPTLQSLICEYVIQGSYDAGYQYLQDWVAWVERLPTVEADPTDCPSLTAIYDDSLHPGITTCLSGGLLDLTTENVLWDHNAGNYILVDHDMVLPDPVPRILVISRMLFFLCHNLRHLFQSSAQRHPLRQIGYSGFLVPQAWDIDRWVDPQAWRWLLQAEARLQSHYAGVPITIEYGEEQTIANRMVPNVATRLAMQDQTIIDGFTHYDQDTRAYQQWIAERDERIQKYETDIAALHQHIQKNEADITTLHGWVAERDERIQKYETDIAALHQHIQKNEADIATFQQHIQKNEADITTLHGWLGERNQQLQQAQAQLAQLQAYQRKIQESRGWRMLRRVRKLRQRVLPPHGRALRMLRLIYRASAVWRQHGMQELVRRSRKRLLRRSHLHVPLALTAPPEQMLAMPDEPDAYRQWIAENEPDAEALRRQTALAGEFAIRPLISVLTPVYNPEPSVIVAMIASVLAQTYADWELWLVDGNPANRQVSATLQRYAAEDDRIHVLVLNENLGIVGNTNVGLQQVQGDFVAFVDHDDLLAPFALFEVASLLNARPQTDMLYSDSDLISSDGSRRFQPLFKPDWSPAIMLSANYATHLCVIRTSLLRELGGLTPGSDGAQDWDLILRISERTHKIAHISKILYHWRDSDVSTAVTIKNKPYVMRAQINAITQHLSRQGIAARTYFDTSGYLRVNWPLVRQTRVSIVIPSRDPQMLQRCISSICTRTSYQEFELLVVDTTSDGAIARRYSGNGDSLVRVIPYTEPFNYSAVNNLAAGLATGTALLFLNDDTEAVDSEWLSELVRWAEIDSIGVVGAKLLRGDGHIQHAGVVIGLGGFAGHPFDHCVEGQQTIYGCVEWYRNYSAVTGACLMIRRELFDRLGGFDERYILCGSDVELCLRVRAYGYQVLYTPFARLRHLESATRGTDIPSGDFALSFVHYRSLLEDGDPYYNPNLSHWSPVPQLRRRGEERPIAFAQRFLEQLGVAAAIEA